MKELNAYVSNIQRFCVHDGPGIRTVVFLLGCPLSCKWCQNPETLDKNPQLMMSNDLCMGCGACIKTCPHGAICARDGKPQTDRTLCERCFACTAECYWEARTVSGRRYTVAELYRDVMKDKEFFVQSGGGVTISGGEPTQHAEFCAALLQKCAGVGRAVETCGYADWKAFELLLPVTDLFLYDLKLYDEEKHRQWTGVKNTVIKDNLKKLASRGKEVIIRIPLIPGVNDTREEFGQMLEFIRGLGRIREVHLLPFHQIGSSKYGQISGEYAMAGWREENAKRVAQIKKQVEDSGFKVSVGGTGFRTGGKTLE